MNKIFVFMICCIGCFGCDDRVNDRTINATEHAKSLELKNPLIKCYSKTCDCTISWETCFVVNNNYQCNRNVATYDCCGKKCSKSD